VPRERHTGICRMRPRSAGALLSGVVALAVALAPLGGCSEARTRVDCDQLLSREKYDDVIKHCDNPYQRASAYLGKAGFDTFALVDQIRALHKAEIAKLLGLTTANVNEKRLLINQAIDAVQTPHGGNQAFALLMASFLGLAVTTAQFLDNGAGGKVALDDILDQSEIDAAIQLSPPAVPALTVWGSSVPAYFSAISGGKPYTLDCTADPSVLKCSGPGTLVYDDADGSGRIAAGAGVSLDQAAVLAGAGSASASGYAVQFADLILPFSLSAATAEPVSSFLGGTNPNGTFNIGLGAYLAYLHTADAELAAAGGSTGGTDITPQIDALIAKLDNGADPAVCASTAALNAAPTFFLDTMDALQAIYAQATGTSRRPAPANPGAGAYAPYNFVDQANFDITVSANFPFWPAGAYAFPAGVRYRILYPKVSGLGAFTLAQATPRIDEADAAFISQFENIPLFSRAGSPANDGRVNILEVLCAGG
jgi:hypothetical protein